MFASGVWNPSKDYCYCPSGFLESLVLMVVSFFFLIVFFIVSLAIFSSVPFVEGVAISNGVPPVGVQRATYVLNVVISSGLGEFL